MSHATRATVIDTPQDDSYRSLSELAHLSPPPIVDAPLLVWRLALWRPIQIFETDQGPNASNDQIDRLKQADNFITDTFIRLSRRDQLRIPGVEDVDAPFYDRTTNTLNLFSSVVSDPLGTPKATRPDGFRTTIDGQQFTLSMRLSWYGRKITFQFEVHAECAALTTYMDLSQASRIPSESIRGEECAERDLYAIDNALDCLNRLLCNGESNRENYERISYDLYRLPRLTIQKYLLGVDNNFASQFGDIFGDFRGVILNASSSADADVALDPFFQPSGWQREIEAMPIGAPRISTVEWQRRLKLLWPFLMARPTEPDKRADLEFSADPKRIEFSVSKILKGRGLLATALGYQPQDPNLQSLPLFYFVYTSGIGARQMGRLVDTLSHMCTFRLAALLNNDKMNRAVPLLDAAENLVRQTFEKLLGSREDDASPQAVEERANILAENLPKIGRKLYAITAPFSENQNDNFDRRIELSRHYVRKFRQLVGTLRLGRVEGFLPYDEFVEHRLGPAFSMADLVAARFNRIRADLNTLRQTEIALRSRLAQEQAARSQAQAAEAEQKIVRLQDFAEKALLLVLVPFYGGELVIEKMRGNQFAYWFLIWAISGSLAFKNVRDWLFALPTAYERLPPRRQWALVGFVLFFECMAVWIYRRLF